ncbi:MAG: SRPBCC family protein [Actinomycetota bacterium]|nr:SRPBCC family protein [Actinomycetota bacterium]
MKNTQPIITFSASVPAKASHDAVYDVLSDLETHLTWAGEQAPNKKFRLLTMDAPGGRLGVGAQFSSTGANGSMTFQDRLTVVVADPGRAFGFDSDSKLLRKHGKTLLSRFAHRYSIRQDGTISYTCDVWPQNYTPYWLTPWFRPMTKLMINRSIRKNMQNLARMAEERDRSGASA